MDNAPLYAIAQSHAIAFGCSDVGVDCVVRELCYKPAR
jgi:hypothetical protein